MDRLSNILKFVVFEVLLKTGAVCFIATFAVCALLKAAPEVVREESTVRGSFEPAVINAPAGTSDTTITPDEESARNQGHSRLKSTPAPAGRDTVEEVRADIESQNVDQSPDSSSDYAVLDDSVITQLPKINGKRADSGWTSFLSDYAVWLGMFARGDFGRDQAGQQISEQILFRFSITGRLVLAALVPALLLSLLFGLIDDRFGVWTLRNAVFVVACLPTFLLGYLLYALWGANFLAAAVTLGLSSGIVNEMERVVRRAIRIEGSREYVETSTAKGLRGTWLPLPGTIAFHTLRNALITIMPRTCTLFGLVVSGSLVVEQVFRLQGLSYMLLAGLGNRDVGRVLVVILLAVLLVRAMSILANILYLLLNPRYGQT